MVDVWLFIGAVITIGIGEVSVKWVLGRVSSPIDSLSDPLSENPKTKERWTKLREEKDEPGAWIGRLERLIFFCSIWLNFWQVIVGWLAFKVASKWEIYKNINFFPQKTDIDGIDNLDYAISRRRIGAKKYIRFLVGTSANVFVAFIGFIIAHGLKKMIIS